MVLAGQPEYAGPLEIRRRPGARTPCSSRTRGTRSAPGRRSSPMSGPAERVETTPGPVLRRRPGRRPPRTSWSAASPTPAEHGDDRPIAAFLTTLEVPAQGEATVVVVLGQADDRRRAEAVIRKYQDAGRRAGRPRRDPALVAGPDGHGPGPDQPARSSTATSTGCKYQALAERIWARRGFYQASGAFGFRDQLQDSVNLIWMDPALARRQILLHASQQFLEGDVVHWFHLLQDGRTGFVGADARLGQPPLAGLGRGRVRRGDRRRLAPRRADALPGVRAAVRAPAGRQARDGVRPAPVGPRGHRLPALPAGRSTWCSTSGWAPTGCR